MLLTIRKLFRDCLTQNDGKSYDPIRVGGAALTVTGLPTFIWGTVYSTIHTQHFDYQGFAFAFGGVAAGMLALATGVSVKARTDTIGDPDFPHPPGEAP